MQYVICVPGFLGSELQSPFGITDDLLWVNYSRLAFCHLEMLKLAPDGVSPDPDVGRACTVGGAVGHYWDPLLTQVELALHPANHTHQFFAYDFRLQLRSTANILLERIRNAASVEEPCTLLCHSMGGLIARAAWALLVDAGETGLVRRIITLGTPHRGSYEAPVVWSRGNVYVEQILAIKNLVKAISHTGGRLPGVPYSFEDLMGVISTWPAFYELLPFADAQGVAEDPELPELYDKANWPDDLPVSQAWLDHARNVWQPFMNEGSRTMPPPSVLIPIAGDYYETAVKTRDASLLGHRDAFEYAYIGDGVVSRNSALIPGHEYHTVTNAHLDLLQDQWVLDNLSELVLKTVHNPPPQATDPEPTRTPAQRFFLPIPHWDRYYPRSALPAMTIVPDC